MRRVFLGETATLRAEFPLFLDGDGETLPVTGVSFVVERVNGAERMVVPGNATAVALVFVATLDVAARGTWEAQARCTSPVLYHLPRLKFEVVEPLDFVSA
jgi:hypothetical protein